MISIATPGSKTSGVSHVPVSTRISNLVTVQPWLTETRRDKAGTGCYRASHQIVCLIRSAHSLHRSALFRSPSDS
jgi:hypothetical protein